MKNDRVFDDKRLLGTLDGVETRFLSEALEYYDDPIPTKTKRARAAMYKRIALLVACIVLCAAAFPVVNYILSIIGGDTGDSGGSAGSSAEETQPRSDTNIIESNSDVIGADYYLYGSDMYYLTGNAFRRCNVVTMKSGKICECEEEDCLLYRVSCLAGIYDDKLYYLARLDKSTIAYLDLKTMEAVKVFEVPFYTNGLNGNFSVYDGYVYYTRRDSFSDPMYLCRVPAEGGNEEKLLECEGETLELVAYGYIITEKRISDNSDPTDITTDNGVLYSYNVDTLQKKELWSTVGSEFYYYVSRVKYLDGKLYFISWWAPGRTSHSYGVEKLLTLDIATGNYECLTENSVYDFCLMNDCIYYFPLEGRTVNYTDYLASYGLMPDYATNYGTSIHKCDLNGENDEVVYENSDIAYLYPKIINGVLFDDGLRGDFPELGLTKSWIHAAIDLTSDKMKLIEIHIQQEDNE